MRRYFYGPSSIFQISSPNMFQLNLLLRPISQMPCSPPPPPPNRFGFNPVRSSNKIVVSTKILRAVLLLGSKCLRCLDWTKPRAPVSRPWSAECVRWTTCYQPPSLSSQCRRRRAAAVPERARRVEPWLGAVLSVYHTSTPCQRLLLNPLLLDTTKPVPSTSISNSHLQQAPLQLVLYV